MNTYNYAGIDTYDINNGKGFGITLFVQGCPHHCEGCLCEFVAGEFKNRYPNKSIWVYSGYTYEQLKTHYDASFLLDLCDILVDGPYIQEKRDLSLPFRGSSNQRIIDLNKTREQNKIVMLNV